MKSTNPFVTNPTSMGMGERIAYGIISAGLIRAASRGWIDPSMVEYLALGIMSGGGAVLGWWLNRPSLAAATVANMSREQLSSPDVAKSVVEAAGQVPNPSAQNGKTMVIASPALAAATTDSPNVVSSAEHKVVEK